ncbi:MAG: hypothetical protein Q9227_003905 [Pyrenula ochraceoflavens]
MTAIQFAAKLLETMLQASLAAIFLGYVRRHVLMSSSALPLGGLLGPYRIRDISFLWSLEFWGALTASHYQTFYKIVLAFTIFAMISLAALVGPSCAVLMLPRLISYPINQDLVILNQAALEFPDQLEVRDGTLADGTQSDKQNIDDSVELRVFEISGDLGARVMEIQTSSSQILEIDYNHTILTWTSTLPAQSTTYALASLESPLKSRSRAIVRQTLSLQPYVVQSCVGYKVEDKGTEGEFVTFRNGDPELERLIPLSDVLSNSTHTQPDIRRDDAKSTLQAGFGSMYWFQSPSPSKYSLLLVIVVYSGSDEIDDLSDHYDLLACTVSARWAKASANYTLDNQVVDFAREDNELRNRSDKLVSISPDLAERAMWLFFNASYAASVNLAVMSSASCSVLALALSDAGQTPPAEYLEPSFLILTNSSEVEDIDMSPAQREAMSEYLERTGYRHQYNNIYVFAQGTWSDPATIAQFSIQEILEGYGYDKSTTPVKLSLVILAIYSFLASTYLIYSFASGYSATSWSSIGDLTLLALNSKQPQHLSGTSVAAETVATYREPLNLRVNDQGSVEMAFANDPGLKKRKLRAVEPNERY